MLLIVPVNSGLPDVHNGTGHHLGMFDGHGFKSSSSRPGTAGAEMGASLRTRLSREDLTHLAA